MNSAGIEQTRRNLVDGLPASHLSPEIVDEVGARFRDFASALSNGDIRALLRATTLIHHVVASLTNNEDAEALCNRLQGFIPTGIKTATEPLACKELFFIWIGTIDARSLQNISVWKRSNPGYRIRLWFDSHCLLASRYRQLLKHQGLALSTSTELIRFQNNVYASLQSKIADGLTFDDALVRHFQETDDGSIGRKLEFELKQAKLLYQKLTGQFTLSDVQDNTPTIMDDEFRHYYFREIALRGNLAAASDILRLHIIHHFGGIYIDCDTLPNLDHVFVQTALYCSQHNISSGFIDVLKSELYMQKIAQLSDFPELGDEPNDEPAVRSADIQAIADNLQGRFGEVVSLIKRDLHALTAENAFRPLDEIWLFHHGLLLSGDPHNRNCFNNNVIIASPQSKVIRIILLEMRRRYRYLDRMGAVDIASEEELPSEESYFGRLLNYRLDALDSRDNATVILTGSGLIFEVIMGLAFRLLNLDDQVSPISVSYALYSRKIGIAFMDQTFYTYDHSQSSWMRAPSAHAIMV